MDFIFAHFFALYRALAASTASALARSASAPARPAAPWQTCWPQ